MRFLASAVVLLTLTNVSRADETVVAHVEVLELSRTRLRELGINGGFKKMPPPAAPGPWTFAALELGAPLLRDIEKWKSQNAVRVLGAPTLVTASGRLASFRDGDENAVSPRKPGLEIELLPRIEAAGIISADFHGRYTEPLPGQSARAQGVAIPALLKREVTTHCELKPGQTLVMRGPTQASHDNVRARGLRLRRVNQSQPDEVELIVLLRLELAGAANPGQASQSAR